MFCFFPVRVLFEIGLTSCCSSSVEETSDVTEAASECTVVWAILIEETLVARAVHHIFSWRILALHPVVLL